VIAPARLAAYDVLRAVNRRHADLPAALATVRQGLPDPRDRALAGEITAGTLRWQAVFDHIITVYAGRPLARLDDEVVDVLRMTLFQLLHLERVPASAAVDDAVNLTKKVGKRSAAPLVNALCRRVSRERNRLPLPSRAPGSSETELDYLAVTLSHPRWLAARWVDRYGFEAAEAWCRFDNEPAPLTLRANRLKTTRDDLAKILSAHGVRTTPTRFAPDGLVVESGNPLLFRDLPRGLFSVQDEASQLVALAVGASPGESVLDVCAAPGGKTTAMAAQMTDRGLLVAADVRANRVHLLTETVQASGAQSIRIVQANAAQGLPFQQVFDRVLVDAPCSGLGTLRRDPDIKWRRTEDEFEALSNMQMRLLASAATVVRPGGILIYATCSSEPEENEHVVERFLQGVSGFRAVPLQLPAPALVNASGHLRTFPFRDGLEAFFAATLVKGRDLR